MTGGQRITSPSFKGGRKYSSAKELYFAGGDGYVSTVTYGVQYYACYQFTASSKEEFERVRRNVRQLTPCVVR